MEETQQFTKNQTFQLESGEKTRRDITVERIKMTYEHMKRRSASLAISKLAN